MDRDELRKELENLFVMYSNVEFFGVHGRGKDAIASQEYLDAEIEKFLDKHAGENK